MVFKVAHASPADIPTLMAIQFKAYAGEPAAEAFYGVDTPENREGAGNRVEACSRTLTGFHALKCVHTDEQTGQETLVGSCQWQLYEHERPECEWRQSHPMYTFEWRPAAQREEIATARRILEDNRRVIFGGKQYGVLMNLVVEPAWQRKGPGGVLTRWGMERMEEKGFPGFLEASEAGYPLYKSLGWSDATPVKFGDGEDASVLKCLRYDPM